MIGKFNVMLYEPTGYRYGHFLHYFLKLLVNGLRAYGHDAVLSRNKFIEGRTTILVGGHLIQDPSVVQAIAAAGPYIVMQTEIVSCGRRLFWSGEQEGAFESIYVPLLRGALRVWDVLQENIGELRAHGVERAMVLQGGYEPALAEIQPRTEPDIDFAFFGSMSEHRQKMIDRLLERKYRVAVLFDEPAVIRNDVISRAKVCLSIRTSDRARHLPWPRICELVNNGALVVAEECDDQDWLALTFMSTPEEGWVDMCEAALREYWPRGAGEMFRERFMLTPFSAKIQQAMFALQV